MTRWLDIAWAEQGTAEVPGRGANPDIVRYFAEVGRPDVTSDETAWCAAFVGSCLARAGVKVQIREGEELLARSYAKIGTEIRAPRVGAVAVVTRGDPTSWKAHVFFVVGTTETHIIGLGGNQSNAVTVAHFPRNSVIALRWPEPPKAAADLSKESRIARSAARQKRDAAAGVGVEALPDPMTPAAPVATAPPPPAPVATAPPPAEALDPGALIGKGAAIQSQIEQGLGLIDFAAQKWQWITGAVALYFLARMAWDAWNIGRWRLEDANTGKTRG